MTRKTYKFELALPLAKVLPRMLIKEEINLSIKGFLNA
jgi:hypothetical protein